MPSDSKKDPKKPVPRGIWLIFISVLAFVYLASNNYPPKKSARITNSFQLEHLVNLDLIAPEKSQKVSINDQLVSFSGCFRQELTEDNQAKFDYLDLLNQKHKLVQSQREKIEASQLLRAKILQAGDYYLNSVGDGLKEEFGGYVLDSGLADALQLFPPIALKSLSPRSLQTLKNFQTSIEQAKHEATSKVETKDLKSFGKALIEQINSPVLSLTGKLKARALLLKTNWDFAETTTSSEIIFQSQKAAAEIKSIFAELGQLKGAHRLNGTQVMRDYAEQTAQWSSDQPALEKLEKQLAKARKEVKDANWYFNNQIVSTRALEKRDFDEFSQWFLGAQEAWDHFQYNRGCNFKAPDQQRNEVLDRTFKSEEPGLNYLNLFITAFPVLAVIFLLYLAFSKQMKGMGSNALSFGKSPAKLLQRGTHRITFRDVAGIEEAKEELQEVVDFLKDPQRFTSLGAQIPKGILCIGPPGTGKTLIAKAVAGEADRPFFSISGSDFVEMFVGVGASRIRDTFDQARKNAPCIIFMDEIDAVGRHRGAGMGGGHDEREQTLNQLLVEMDGFDSNEGIILMAATNRPDVLDKALMRPGRFDRQVVIDLPDIKGRFEILKLHARKIKLHEGVELMKLARATAGCSGADLKNILNEAALMAVRKGHGAVRAPDVSEACDKVRFGKERRSLEISEQEKRSTAFHEAGHAIVGATLKRCDPVEKITIIPRGMSLGATYMLPTKNRLGYWREELYELLAMIMGGRCAEEKFVKDISSGAKNDIERATDIARSMICEWGMSDKLGLVALEDGSQRGYATGMPNQANRAFSPHTAQIIDEEVYKICNQAHQRARQIILEKEEIVVFLADMLVEFETLDAKDLQKVLDKTFDIQAKRQQLIDSAEQQSPQKEKEKEEKKETAKNETEEMEPKKT